MLRWLVLCCCFACCGCSLLPEVAHQPTIHNPFPQLSKIAIAPFFNLSSEPSVDGRQFALAYFNELQLVPGFEVIPVGVVERAIQDNGLAVRGPQEARRLAQILGADAVVVGAITDYSPYYPPRCTLQVEWYAANPGFHAIPPGYGLPWGTPEEQGIPPSLVLEAEMALAREQLKTQSPPFTPEPVIAPRPRDDSQPQSAVPGGGSKETPTTRGQSPVPPSQSPGIFQPTAHQAPVGVGAAAGAIAAAGGVAAAGMIAGPPPQWPDPRGFVPPPPASRPPTCWPSEEPVMRHTQAYNGHDSRFTEALNAYYYFREDARFGGWQSYLQRSEDFNRFCCHMHIWEMLTARGGAGETQVVWRWRTVR